MPMQVSFIKQKQAFSQATEAKVSELIVAPYRQKLTYGEFAQLRYQIGKAATDADQQHREARLIQDQDGQLQARWLDHADHEMARMRRSVTPCTARDSFRKEWIDLRPRRLRIAAILFAWARMCENAKAMIAFKRTARRSRWGE